MSAPAAEAERFDAVQAALRCASCGGQRRYAPATALLTCESCGSASEIIDTGALEARRELAFDPNGRDDEPPEVDHAHRCDACGGEVVFVGRAVSDRCPYCDGPVVLHGGHAHYLPSGIIPFRVEKAQAEALVMDWIARRWAAPGELPHRVAEGHIAAVYAPFWTFDAVKAISYTARKRVGSGKNARWRAVRGETTLRLDDTIIAASDHVTPAIRDGIMHGFHPDLLKSYLPDYLAGFAAELHGQKVSDGLAAMKRDVEVLVEKRIRRDIGAGRISGIRYRARVHGVRFRRVLLPLWIHHYSYRGTPMRVVVSGIDGRSFGQRPYSTAKLMAYSAAFVIPAFVFGMFGGAALAP